MDLDPDQTSIALLSKTQQLLQEYRQLKLMLSIARENIELRARIRSFNNETLQHLPVCSASGRNQASLWQNTVDESQFRKDLEQPKSEHRSSSPTDPNTCSQSTVHPDMSQKRLLGEIAFQLDRRILSYVFQGHRRFYGFTLFNIPQKIIEVSTHPLTGKVDKDYQLTITQRYAHLMKRLNQMGYKTNLHPAFAEFVVNTYGILNEKPNESTQQVDYNNPQFLCKVIMKTAPIKLQKDLLLFVICLCSMAEMDREPLLLW